MTEISLRVIPHGERGGYRLDRFDAYLGDELLVTSRQPYYAGARALIERGYDPDTMLRMHPDAKAYPLSWWAQWMVEETNRDGLTRRKYRPFLRQEAPRTGEEESAGVQLPGDGIGRP